MRGLITRLMTVLALLVLLSTISCTSNDLDSSDSADVLMLIQTLTTTKVTANRQAATSGTCSVSSTPCQTSFDCAQTEVCVIPQTCVLDVEEWTANIKAEPKNSLALPPFNNIVMFDVTITYDWANPLLDAEPGLQGPFVAGLGNVTVEAGGANSVMFIPIPSDLLNTLLPGNLTLEGASALVTLRFRGITVEGTTVTQTAVTNLLIDICT